LGIDGDRRASDNRHGDLSAPYEPLLLTPNFDIGSVSTDEAIVVEVSGDVDLLTAPVLSEELRRAQRTHSEVIVDLEKVDFMGCVGLRVLVRAAAAGPGQPRLSVTPGPPQIQRLFRMTGTDQTLRLVEPTRGPSPSQRRNRWLWTGTLSAVRSADAA
jgi:anti-anti-sigma factor